MNIAYILPEFVTEKECGGLGVYFDNISRLLANRGHHITVIVRSEAEERIDYYPGVIVYRVWTDLSGVNPYLQGSYYREWSRNLNRKLLQLHGNSGHFDIAQYSNFTGLAVSRTNIPTVIRISSDLPLLRAADRIDFDIHETYECIKVTDFLEDISIMRADGVYAPSMLLADRIGKRTGKRVEVIESPYYPHGEKEEQAGESDDFGGWREDRPFILTFGTLKILKGIKVIGDCIHEVLGDNPGICWVFAGARAPWKDHEGKETDPVEYLKAGAGEYANRVIYLGKLKSGSLRRLIRKAVLCVMPSRIDNLPNACIEAMALGKTVIGTRGASFEQLIVDGRSGFLVERENPLQLAEALKSALKLNDDELRRMGNMAMARIDAMSPEIIAEKLLAFYDVVRSKVNGAEVSPDYSDRYYKEIVGKYNQAMLNSGMKDINRYLL